MVKWLSKMFGRQSETTSDTMQRIEFIERLILNHQRRLQKLKEHEVSPGRDDYLPPEIHVEIEDLETEIQQLKASMENEEDKEELVRAVAARERRLEVFQKVEVRQTSGNYEQEIKEIEATIQELQSELE